MPAWASSLQPGSTLRSGTAAGARWAKATLQGPWASCSNSPSWVWSVRAGEAPQRPLALVGLEDWAGAPRPAQRAVVIDEHDPRHVRIQQGPGRAQHLLQRPGEAPFNVEGVQGANASRQVRRFDRHGLEPFWLTTGEPVSGPGIDAPGM